jgi:hypothetical protein
MVGAETALQVVVSAFTVEPIVSTIAEISSWSEVPWYVFGPLFPSYRMASLPREL